MHVVYWNRVSGGKGVGWGWGEKMARNKNIIEGDARCTKQVNKNIFVLL
jgi:hypothetical protein